MINLTKVNFNIKMKTNFSSSLVIILFYVLMFYVGIIFFYKYGDPWLWRKKSTINSIAIETFIIVIVGIITFVVADKTLRKNSITLDSNVISKKIFCIAVFILFFLIVMTEYMIYTFHKRVGYLLLGWDTVYYVYYAKIFIEHGLNLLLSQYHVRYHSFLYWVFVGLLSSLLNVDPYWIELLSPYLYIPLVSWVVYYYVKKEFKKSGLAVLSTSIFLVWPSFIRMLVAKRRFLFSYVLMLYMFTLTSKLLYDNKGAKHLIKNLLVIVILLLIQSLVLIHFAVFTILTITFFIVFNVLLNMRGKPLSLKCNKRLVLIMISILLSISPGFYFYAKSGLKSDISRAVAVKLKETKLLSTIGELPYKFSLLYMFGGILAPFTVLGIVLYILKRGYFVSKNSSTMISTFETLSITIPLLIVLSTLFPFFPISALGRLNLIFPGFVYSSISFLIMYDYFRVIVKGISRGRKKLLYIYKIFFIVFLISILSSTYMFTSREAAIHFKPFISKDLYNKINCVKNYLSNNGLSNRNYTFLLLLNLKDLSKTEVIIHLDGWIGSLVGYHYLFIGPFSLLINGIAQNCYPSSNRLAAVYHDAIKKDYGIEGNYFFNAAQLVINSEVIVIDDLYYPIKHYGFDRRYLTEVENGVYLLNREAFWNYYMGSGYVLYVPSYFFLNATNFMVDYDMGMLRPKGNLSIVSFPIYTVKEVLSSYKRGEDIICQIHVYFNNVSSLFEIFNVSLTINGKHVEYSIDREKNALTVIYSGLLTDLNELEILLERSLYDNTISDVGLKYLEVVYNSSAYG